jgi:hypothetical protein
LHHIARRQSPGSIGPKTAWFGPFIIISAWCGDKVAESHSENRFADGADFAMEALAGSDVFA